MSQTSWRSPDTISAPGWIHGAGPNGLYNDGAYIEWPTGGVGNSTTNPVTFTNFGFAAELPPHCNIDGIFVKIKHRTYGSNPAYWSTQKLILPSGTQSIDKGQSNYVGNTWGESYSGNYNDKFGLALTRDDVVNASFGFISAHQIFADYGMSEWLDIDYLAMQVYYTTTSKFSSIYLKQAGTWGPTDPLMVKVDGIWKEPNEVRVKDGGVWKLVYGYT